MVLLLVFMQLTRDLFAIAKFLSRKTTSRSLSTGLAISGVTVQQSGRSYAERGDGV